MSVYTVSQAARHFNVPPRKISGLFYDRRLDDSVCPIVDGRRLIPTDYLPEVERVLRDRGILNNEEVAAS